jgi:hypothetical protein
MTSSDATTKALNDFAQGVKISIVDLVNSIVEKAEDSHVSDIYSAAIVILEV